MTFVSIVIAIQSLLLLACIVIGLKVVSSRRSPQDVAVLERLVASLERHERDIKDQFDRSRESHLQLSKTLNDSVLSRMTDIATLQKNQLDTFSKHLETLTKSNEERQDKLRETVEKRLHTIQEDNGKKLEQMRQTVDEKLHATLEKRLGESFKIVSDRLELVHKGLGEMQTLATGVGDLKKVLTNVKTRGGWGEVQLEALLEQIMSPDQYEKNVKIKPNSREFVEFAIKLPGKSDDPNQVIWLPIDAKFPQDFYQSLVDAQEKGDRAAVDDASKQLAVRLKLEAKTMKEKYISPPNTTDFGILFLPTEGLYAEALRLPDVYETLQRDHRVLLAGPATLAALLNSLQMGFRTLAIEKRSSEVWRILGSVKAEFGKFGDLLEKTRKKIQETGNVIEEATRKTRTIERKLRDVEALPELSTTDFSIQSEQDVLNEKEASVQGDFLF